MHIQTKYNCPFYFLSLLLLNSLNSFSQYTQNFDTLVNTGTDLYTLLPDGWGIYEVGTGAAADGRYTVGTGSSNTGNAYSFGAADGNPERSLGTVASGSNFPTIGVIFFNEQDTVINNITVTYTGEQWRFGGRTTATKDTLRFEYSLDATGIVNDIGTWIRVQSLDFLSPVSSTATNAAIALDGNATANRQKITYTITGLNIQPGASIVLRWSDFNIASNDDGLGIDDFFISVGLVPGVMSSGGTTTGGGTGTGGSTTDSISTSTPIFENKVAIDSSFIHLYGNLHAHSTHSDGRPSSLEPVNDYEFARMAQGMDFLGISEHNHSTAGLQIADYKKGSVQADSSNGKLNSAGQTFTALHGMEWGTISGGGHVLVYGFKDSLINWEANNYDIFVQKSDYISLFEKVRNQPGAVAMLAHPNTNDFTGLIGAYKGVADSAVMSVAIESGPAFSTATTYDNYPASLAYINYYRSLLRQGYRVGAHMDQDNHEMTYGTANGNRIVVLSKTRTREGILDGVSKMRVYASNDYNSSVSFTIGDYILGSSIVSPQPLIGIVNHTDANGEAVSAIQVYGGKVGGSEATLIHAATTNTTFVTNDALGETWYYYAVITQMDGNKIVTSPVWVTRPGGALPIVLTDFKGVLNKGKVSLKWDVATEVNASHYIVEKLVNLGQFEPIGRVDATGGGVYTLTDNAPVTGMNYYRLKQVDKDGRFEYSKVISVNFETENIVTIAPNPTRGNVRIKTSVTIGEKVLVQVIDAAGNMVYNTTTFTGTTIDLNLTHLPGGTYVIRMNDKISKVVINR